MIVPTYLSIPTNLGPMKNLRKMKIPNITENATISAYFGHEGGGVNEDIKLTLDALNLSLEGQKVGEQMIGNYLVVSWYPCFF